MVKASFNGVIIAQSNETILMEDNHYFPLSSVDQTKLQSSTTTTRCPWKGVANYYDVVVDGETQKDAAWTYLRPSLPAQEIKEHIAFWKGVKVEEV